ncbi:MAG: response regulator [Oscillospiraceae bacterium]|nr:response regulator [Oscillospiraceae bacterium]
MDEVKKHRILVVDDENSNIMALSHILSPEYTVYAAKSGAGALSAAEKYQPDLILLDIIMPDLDGFEVLAALKSSDKTKDIPVVFLTSMIDPQDATKGLSLGAVDYIIKPFSRGRLLKRVEMHLHLNRG